MKKIKRTIKSKSGKSYDGLQTLVTGPLSSGSIGEPEHDIEEAERFARDLLSAAGLPTKFVSNGRLITTLVEDRKLEPEYHAAHVLFYAHVVREHLANNRSRDVFYAATRMTHHQERAYLAINEHAILVGREQVNSGKESRMYGVDVIAKWRRDATALFAKERNLKDVAYELTRNDPKAFYSCKKEIADLNPKRRPTNKGPVSPR